MDPDECLKEIRELLKRKAQFEGYKPSASRAEALRMVLDELSERVDALDQWITNGGFLPAVWRPQKG